MTINKRALMALGLAAAAMGSSLLALAQPKPGAKPAAPAEDIVFGASVPLTGVFAFAGIAVDQGIKDYLSILNEAGGVKGRKLRYVAEDTGYKVDQSMAVFKRITGQNKVSLYYADSTGFVKTVNPERRAGHQDVAGCRTGGENLARRNAVAAFDLHRLARSGDPVRAAAGQQYDLLGGDPLEQRLDRRHLLLPPAPGGHRHGMSMHSQAKSRRTAAVGERAQHGAQLRIGNTHAAQFLRHGGSGEARRLQGFVVLGNETAGFIMRAGPGGETLAQHPDDLVDVGCGTGSGFQCSCRLGHGGLLKYAVIDGVRIAQAAAGV